MKLTSDIHVVGGGYYGFNISGRLDCHVYVINSGTELAIVDPGCGIDRDFEKIISNIRDDGLDPKKIKKPDISSKMTSGMHKMHRNGFKPLQNIVLQYFENTEGPHKGAFSSQ